MTDLFGWAETAAPGRPPPLAAAPPLLYPVPRRAGSVAWERLLSRLECDDILFDVSAWWTKVVIEVATGSTIGRQAWRADGDIMDLGSAGGFAPGRLVYLAPDDALALHRRSPLMIVGRPGTHAFRLRARAPGDPPSDIESAIALVRTAPRSAFA